MKKYFKIAAMIFILAAFTGTALAEKITVQQEVPEEKQQNNVTAAAGEENKLSSKRMRDKIDSNSTDLRRTDKERMMKYLQFKDGEGEKKTRNKE